MKRIAGLCLAIALAGCGITLPSEESVLLHLSKLNAVPGQQIDAVLVNRSSEQIGLGVLPCTSRIIDQASMQPIAPPTECELPLLILEPGARTAFSFAVPGMVGNYRLEVHAMAPYADSGWEELSVRSPVFAVTGSTLSD